MIKIHLHLSIILSLCSSNILSGLTPELSTTSPKDQNRVVIKTYKSRIGKKNIEYYLDIDDVFKLPNFPPTKTIPLSILKIEDIAKKELNNHITNILAWGQSKLVIDQIKCPVDGKIKWVFIVGYSGIGNDFIDVPISPNGKTFRAKVIESP